MCVEHKQHWKQKEHGKEHGKEQEYMVTGNCLQEIASSIVDPWQESQPLELEMSASKRLATLRRSAWETEVSKPSATLARNDAGKEEDSYADTSAYGTENRLSAGPDALPQLPGKQSRPAEGPERT